MASVKGQRSAARYLLFGLGAGLGLGIWSTLSIVVWQHFAGRGVVRPAPAGAPMEQLPGPPAEATPPPAPAAPSMQMEEGASAQQPAATFPRVIPQELQTAPSDWISEQADAGAGRGYSVRLSFSPPGLRLEECGGSPGEDPCHALVAGRVSGLTADTVTVADSSGKGAVTLGWKIAGRVLTLTREGRKLRFRPGTREELLGLLGAGAGGGH